MANETHKVVVARGATSYFMVGDDGEGHDGEEKGDVLPGLLRAGWSVESTCAATTTRDAKREAFVYFILRKAP